ncbi:hypothetical protein AS25_08300 [Kocuria marina]|uniref:Uncharacterized protein n=1 Tax=Kocuria marina TaxID=223184 RepID=A0A0B0D886_9MICC|nr:hypothetical protein [Kocuria marina]KHE74201.1 hypothetical protein AS25_08300 [Kocuria marina]
MNTETITETMLVFVCECCALMLTNGDDSECRDYYRHGHIDCDLGAGAVMTGEQVETPAPTTCDGCHQRLGVVGHEVLVTGVAVR